jgi:hemolysin III
VSRVTSYKRPRRFKWDYDRAEICADGVMHAVGGCLAVTGAAVFSSAAALDLLAEPIIEGVLTYSLSLVAMIGFSAAYNMWPPSSTKGLLRRFDHAAIYLLIAGTYTPFLLPLRENVVASSLLSGIWLMAGFGIMLKLALPGRFDRFSYVLYLLLGWSGVMVYRTLTSSLPHGTLLLLGTGGILYSIGLVFHLWQSLRFQNAIWHGFVLLAAACHYFAVVEYATVTGA